MAKVGYARVSTRDQHEESQLDILDAEGCERIFVDKVSGRLASRSQWDACLEYLRPGDTLIVTRLARIARSMRNLIELSAMLAERGIDLVVLKQQIDTRTPAGRLTFHIIGAIDEFTADLISEGTLEGLEAARARGRKGGRPPKITPAKLATARKLYDELGEDGKRAHTVQEIADIVGVGRATLYRHLDKAEERAPEPDAASVAASPKASENPPCQDCGKGTKARREHPEHGDGWYCSTCVTKAKDRQFKRQRHEAKLAAMTPEQRAEYDRESELHKRRMEAKWAARDHRRELRASGEAV